MVQGVSRQPLAVEDQERSKGNTCGICGGQSVTRMSKKIFYYAKRPGRFWGPYSLILER
jgi:hypothetical protein